VRRYACYLLFQLKTHSVALQDKDSVRSGSGAGQGDAELHPVGAEGGDEGPDPAEVPALSLSGALALLTAITATVAVHSE
jgi:hypothetical protein